LNGTRFGLPTSSVVVRSRCLETVGIFDERLRMYEDLDLWVRLVRAFPVGFLPRASVAKRLYDRNYSRRRHKFPEDLRLVIQKNGLQSEGF
jgi:GT2 family glycosyltransferase